jgi:hypothetical protein
MRNVSSNLEKKVKTHILWSVFFSEKVALCDYVEKCGIAGHATGDNI